MVTMATMAAMGPAVVPLALAGPLVVGLTKLISLEVEMWQVHLAIVDAVPIAAFGAIFFGANAIAIL